MSSAVIFSFDMLLCEYLLLIPFYLFYLDGTEPLDIDFGWNLRSEYFTKSLLVTFILDGTLIFSVYTSSIGIFRSFPCSAVPPLSFVCLGLRILD